MAAFTPFSCSISNAMLCHHQVRLQENYYTNVYVKMETNSEDNNCHTTGVFGDYFTHLFNDICYSLLLPELFINLEQKAYELNLLLITLISCLSPYVDGCFFSQRYIGYCISNYIDRRTCYGACHVSLSTPGIFLFAIYLC